MKQLIILAGSILLAACQTLPTSTEWVARGDAYLKDGKPVQALQAYQKAARLNPDNMAVYASRGAAYFVMGNYQAAQQDFTEVLKRNPYRAGAYTALSSTLAAQGDYQNALLLINQALQLSPNRPEVFFTRGGINFMLGKYDQAVADYSFVLQLRPAADVYNARGAAYMKLGNEKAAEADFAKAKSGTVPEKLNIYRMID